MFFKKTTILFLTTFLLFPFSINAYSDYIIAGGENIGIELQSKHIMIVGTYEVNGKMPVNIKQGDLITKVNDTKVSNIDEMVNIISSNKTDHIALEIIRNNKTLKTSIPLYKDDNNVYKTGLYVKDSVSGIGTLSFIDPNTKLFGALGHEIIDSSTNQILEIKDGKIYNSKVTSIDKSERGLAGEKNAELDYNDTEGEIKENTPKGIFGIYTKEIANKNLYKVAKENEVNLGKATILTVLDNDNIGEYDINITKINTSKDEIKNIVFEITDPELLEKTGGIVQGMSGSPIIQNDEIVGAITHVVVDNPIKGYAIFITKMLEEAEN